MLLEVYREYPINPIADIWEKLDRDSINLLIGQTLEHRKPQEERDKELAIDLYTKLKEEQGLTSTVTIDGQVISAENLLNFNFNTPSA